MYPTGYILKVVLKFKTKKWHFKKGYFIQFPKMVWIHIAKCVKARKIGHVRRKLCYPVLYILLWYDSYLVIT